MSMLFITHDFGVVEDVADDVVVMFQVKLFVVAMVFYLSQNTLRQEDTVVWVLIVIVKPIDYVQLNLAMEKL